MNLLSPRASHWLGHAFAAACGLGAAAAGFQIGARVEGFTLATLMALNAAVCGALLAVSVVDAAHRLRRWRLRRHHDPAAADPA